MLSRKDIESALVEFATRLDAAGVEVVVHVVGGAAMVLAYDESRGSTRDVDSWFPPASARREVLRVVEELAVERGLPADWLNDKANVFIPESADTSGWRVLLSVGRVVVKVADAEVMFAMKMRAGRPARDFADLDVLARILGITTRAAAVEVFERNYPWDEMKPTVEFWLRTLD